MTHYRQFLDYLDVLQESRVKSGLERIQEACKALDHPEKDFKSIHIAGTNGKGSTAAFLEAILRESGYTVGLYTSPHLVCVRERIQVNRQAISEEEIGELFVFCRDVILSGAKDPSTPHPTGALLRMRGRKIPCPLSYFEILTLLAFLYFSQKNVDFAVIETGLGGRWDATNVITPPLSVLTPIDIDHTAYLGSNIVSIAKEKCGIVKEGIPVVTAPQKEEVMRVIEETCRMRSSPLTIVQPNSDLANFFPKGSYQVVNGSVALEAASQINQLGYSLKCYPQSLKNVSWPGRLDLRCLTPLVSDTGGLEILIDGAHNPHGFEALFRYLSENFKGREIVMIFSAMKDKNIAEMIHSVKPLVSKWIFVPLPSPRAASQKDLEIALGREDHVLGARNPQEAVSQAEKLRYRNPLIVVAGSLYLVGEFLKG